MSVIHILNTFRLSGIMSNNVTIQIQRRSLIGSKIRNITFTCYECPPLDYWGYVLQICFHKFLRNDLLADMMWEHVTHRVFHESYMNHY